MLVLIYPLKQEYIIGEMPPFSGIKGVVNCEGLNLEDQSHSQSYQKVQSYTRPKGGIQSHSKQLRGQLL